MRGLLKLNKIALAAVLLLCLGGTLVLQGAHLHLDNHQSHDCLLCHQGAAAAAEFTTPAVQPAQFFVLPQTRLCLHRALDALRPPVRAPPSVLV